MYSYKTEKNAIRYSYEYIEGSRAAMWFTKDHRYHITNTNVGYDHQMFYKKEQFLYFIDELPIGVRPAILTPVCAGYAEDTGLAFVCVSQDPEVLGEIRKLIHDDDITAAAFGTDTGDYSPLLVRYGYPSYRAGGQWYEVK